MDWNIHWMSHFCRLQYIVAHRDHFARRLSRLCPVSFCPSGRHIFLVVRRNYFSFAGDTCIPWNAIILVGYIFFDGIFTKNLKNVQKVPMSVDVWSIKDFSKFNVLFYICLVCSVPFKDRVLSWVLSGVSMMSWLLLPSAYIH